MSCERCGGLMVIETICDLVEDKSLRRNSSVCELRKL
jgi:hypothetical protein